MDTPPTKKEIDDAKNALLNDPAGDINDISNKKDVPPLEENIKHANVLQFLIENPEYIPPQGGSSRRRRRSLSKSSRKYKKSTKRVFRKKSRSTRRR
jgi:hypothetical protein